MNRYKIKLNNKKIIGYIDIGTISKLFSENKIFIENEFQLYPIGDWEVGSKIEEIAESYNSANPKFEEFQFSKVDTKPNQN